MAAPICVARIGAAHGVRGAVKLWTFTEDPLAVKAYGPLTTRDGARQFEVTHVREAKDHLVATFKGVTTRDEAERLNGIELYVPREKLPATDDDEYYHADLIGLAAVTAANEPLGRVVAIHNFGAGDLIEVNRAAGGSTEMLPFNEITVPVVDVAAGRIVVAAAEASFAPSPLAGGDKEAKPNRMRGRDGTQAATQPHAAVGSRRRRSTLSRKRSG